MEERAMVSNVLARLGVDWSVLKKRRMFHLALLLILSVGLQVAFAVADNVTSGGCGYGYGGNCVVPCTGGEDAYGNVHCDGYVGSDGYVHGDAYPGCNGYVACDGYVRADGYVGCTATSNDGTSVGCDAYVVCNWVRCDAYPRCPSVGCTGYPGGCPSDLVVTGADIPDTLNKGDTVDLSWDVMNAGAGTAASRWGYGWSDAVYLSQSGAIDQYTPMIGYYYHQDPLSPGYSYTATDSYDVGNIPSGEYYVVVSADAWNVVDESNKTNNVSVIKKVTVTGEDPDLTITSLDAARSVYKGETTDISFTVENQGQGMALPEILNCPHVATAASEVSVAADGYSAVPGCGNLRDILYLSNDNILDSEDRYLGEIVHAANVAPGESYSVTLPTQIANLLSGDYYLIVKTDGENAILETNEDNNMAMSFVTVTGPDPDLVPTSINAPDVAGAGQPINASWNVYNQGEGIAVSGWYDNLYFSTDTTLDNSDYMLANSWHNDALPAGGSYTASGWTWDGHNAWIPSVTPGTYYLIVKTDHIPWEVATNRILESNEDNNILVKQITITAPDLTVTSIDAPESAAAGSTFNPSWTVYNDSSANAIGSWNDSLYISGDNNLDSGDTQIGWGWQWRYSDPFRAGSSYTNSCLSSLPYNLAPGTYYLIATTDTNNYLSEENENNNTQVRQITITPRPAPDLAVVSLNAPEAAQPDTDIYASWTVYNQGNAPAWAGWYDGLYISSDNNLDSGDSQIGWGWQQRYYDPFLAGSSYMNSYWSSIPYNLESGTYYLIATTDIYNYLSESNEDNNTRVRQIVIDGTRPVISGVSVTPDPCGHVTVSWTTDEPTTGAAQAGYLGMNAASDSYLGTSHSIEISGLTPGSSYPVTITATDPAGNVSSASGGSFTAPVSVKPALTLSGVSVFWASYADYSQRLLSVSFSLSNNGAGPAYGVAFTGSSATNGVTLNTTTPMLVGDVASGATTNVPVKYYVPEGVNTFNVGVTFSGEDVCGNSYAYPE